MKMYIIINMGNRQTEKNYAFKENLSILDGDQIPPKATSTANKV